MSLSFYRVKIWELEDADESWLESAHANLGRVASVTVIARGPREAAARAYVRALGRRRVRTLVHLGAPAFIIRAERNVRALARSLEKTANWSGPCYRLTNGV
jgi:transcription initiation factor TFIIIB Brf1 subunit/transcription initiation factor TFIIB